MSPRTLRAHLLIGLAVYAALATGGTAQTPQRAGPPAPPAAPTRGDILRGEYSEFRANNDLLSYHLDIRVEPDKKFISGKNTITFGMLKDATRVQLDLYANLNVDKILYGTTPLKYERELNTVFVDFPRHAQDRPGRRDRLLLLGDADAERAVRGLRLQPGSRGPAVDLHRVRGSRARPSGGRTKISGATKSRTWRSASRSPTASWTSQTAGSRRRPTSATASHAGTGSSTTPSTTTTCRSTSASTSTSARSSAT